MTARVGYVLGALLLGAGALVGVQYSGATFTDDSNLPAQVTAARRLDPADGLGQRPRLRRPRHREHHRHRRRRGHLGRQRRDPVPAPGRDHVDEHLRRRGRQPVGLLLGHRVGRRRRLRAARDRHRRGRQRRDLRHDHHRGLQHRQASSSTPCRARCAARSGSPPTWSTSPARAPRESPSRGRRAGPRVGEPPRLHRPGRAQTPSATSTRSAYPTGHLRPAGGRTQGRRSTYYDVQTGILVDNTAPTVTVNKAAGQADPTNARRISFTVVFNEPVTGFGDSDVTLGGTSAGSKTATVTGSGTTYNIAVTGMSGNGTVTAIVPSASATDEAGNPTGRPPAETTVCYDGGATSVSVNQRSDRATPPTDHSSASLSSSASRSQASPAATSRSPARWRRDQDREREQRALHLQGQRGRSEWFRDRGRQPSPQVRLRRLRRWQRGFDQHRQLRSANSSTDGHHQSGSNVMDPTNATPITFDIAFSEPVEGFTATRRALSNASGGGSRSLIWQRCQLHPHDCWHDHRRRDRGDHPSGAGRRHGWHGSEPATYDGQHGHS